MCIRDSFQTQGMTLRQLIFVTGVAAACFAIHEARREYERGLEDEQVSDKEDVA